jgi:hypothetical protein
LATAEKKEVKEPAAVAAATAAAAVSSSSFSTSMKKQLKKKLPETTNAKGESAAELSKPVESVGDQPVDLPNVFAELAESLKAVNEEAKEIS